MPSRIDLRLALATILAAGLSAPAVLAQSNDSQSVAEAARRAREQKKAATKAGKVFTDDDVKHAPESEAAQAPGAAAPGLQSTGAGASGEPASKDEKAKQIAALKEQIKQAQSDLSLIQREQALQQDTYYSNPDYIHDIAGKAKLDGIKQQVADKQEALDKLKTRLAELGGSVDNANAATAPGATTPGAPGAANPGSTTGAPPAPPQR